MRNALLCLIATCLLCTRTSIACFWDYDTLRDERRGLPGILEVLSGRYEQHSRYFYEQRIVRMNALLQHDPKNLDAWDNLAVAYQKTGDNARAIATILKKDAIAPGQYTTYANLGTFEMVKGDLDGAIEHLKRAIQINPDAHFGREEYQLKLAEYLRDNKLHPETAQVDFLGLGPGNSNPESTLPQTRPSTQTTEASETPDAPPAEEPSLDSDEAESAMLYVHYARHQGRGPQLKSNVTDGLVGMLRYGPGGSAELYLALGDLLTAYQQYNLAYRAYGRALELHHPRERFIKAVMAAERENLHDPSDTEPAVINAERADAAAWVAAYQQFEDDLVRQGKDAEDPENLKPFYKAHGVANQPVGFALTDYAWSERLLVHNSWVLWIYIGVPCVAAVLLLRLLVRLARRSRKIF